MYRQRKSQAGTWRNLQVEGTTRPRVLRREVPGMLEEHQRNCGWVEQRLQQEEVPMEDRGGEDTGGPREGLAINSG